MKSAGIVTFGESKRMHSEAMKEHIWALGGESVSELYEYKNLRNSPFKKIPWGFPGGDGQVWN